MAAIQTIKVKRDGPKGFRIINLSSFDPAVHEAYDVPAPAVKPVEPAAAPVAVARPATPSSAPRTVAKGPKGLWFVMDGEKRVSKGFASEAEAYAAMEA